MKEDKPYITMAKYLTGHPEPPKKKTANLVVDRKGITFIKKIKKDDPIYVFPYDIIRKMETDHRKNFLILETEVEGNSYQVTFWTATPVKKLEKFAFPLYQKFKDESGLHA